MADLESDLETEILDDMRITATSEEERCELFFRSLDGGRTEQQGEEEEEVRERAEELKEAEVTLVIVLKLLLELSELRYEEYPEPSFKSFESPLDRKPKLIGGTRFLFDSSEVFRFSFCFWFWEELEEMEVDDSLVSE